MKKCLIHKKGILVEDKQLIDLPIGYTILSVQNQNDIITIWYKFDEVNIHNRTKVNIKLITTGEIFEEDELCNMLYIGTVQLKDGLFVTHVFVDYSVQKYVLISG